MRWILGIVIAVLVVVIGIGLVAAPAVLSAQAARAEARAIKLALEAEHAAREAEEQARAALMRTDEALMRLEAELAQAGPVVGKTDEQRLEEAWAWVRANRDPDRPYNELEAKMLALMSAFFDGEEKSASWLINTSLLEFEMIRAMDVDGDGRVSNEELEMFIKENVSLMMATDHPYLIDRFDKDGDGQLSMEEQMAVMEIFSGQGAMSGTIERAQLELWDTNLDGVLSDEEREAGRVAARERFESMLESTMEMSLSHMSEEEQERVREQIKQHQAEMMESQSEMMLMWAVAEDFMTAMRLENMSQEDLQAAMMSEMPQPLNYMDFDLDGDGILNDEEQAAFQSAAALEGERMQEWGARQMALMMRMQFDHVMSQSDLDGDGRMSPDEWDARLEMLIAERDRRLFLHSYDLDGDGRVTSSELGKYLDWYSDGSLRADANYDGVVDARDLELMLRLYQEQ